MTQKQGLYLRWRWSQDSGAVASRCSGEATRCRQTSNGEEDDRVREDGELVDVDAEEREEAEDHEDQDDDDHLHEGVTAIVHSTSR